MTREQIVNLRPGQWVRLNTIGMPTSYCRIVSTRVRAAGPRAFEVIGRSWDGPDGYDLTALVDISAIDDVREAIK